MQLENLEIRVVGDEDLKALDVFTNDQKISKADNYFIRQYESQLDGGRLIFLALIEDVVVGYCILNWEPKYGFFKTMGIPETQDLNVHKDFRQRGIASAMIAHCEDLAMEKKCEYMGISVGLSGSYGSAQRLYVKLGYVPDGHGITYDRKTVNFGAFRPVDDDLCLMMLKTLKNSPKKEAPKG